MTRFVLVTGTDTGVGKTIATAALAVHYASQGRVLMVKPAQTGIESGEPTDADVVRRLAGCEARELVSLAHPLAPDAAARLVGVDLPTIAHHARAIVKLAPGFDVVIVEGAGGIMVRLDTEGGTLLDLAAPLQAQGAVDLVVVTRSGLGTLNHTELTVQAARARGLSPAGLVLGAWPADPGLAERLNRDQLPALTKVPVIATLPADAGALQPAEFRSQAPGWFVPESAS